MSRSIFDNVPHADLVVKDGIIEIPSIFMFTGGPDELFPFLGACREKNCTVIFKNENITAEPEDRGVQLVKYGVYSTLAACPGFMSQYLRYRLNLDTMNWEAISK